MRWQTWCQPLRLPALWRTAGGATEEAEAAEEEEAMEAPEGVGAQEAAATAAALFGPLEARAISEGAEEVAAAAAVVVAGVVEEEEEEAQVVEQEVRAGEAQQAGEALAGLLPEGAAPTWAERLLAAAWCSPSSTLMCIVACKLWEEKN
jgi:hypothetical protein